MVKTLRNLNKLEFLDICSNASITNYKLNTAIKETKDRKNNIVLETGLEMYIEGTEINFNKINNISSLFLHIIFYN